MQRRVVAEKIDDRGEPPRQRCAALRVRLEDADLVTRRGQQIGYAVAHQAAADYADFLLVHVSLSVSAAKENLELSRD